MTTAGWIAHLVLVWVWSVSTSTGQGVGGGLASYRIEASAVSKAKQTGTNRNQTATRALHCTGWLSSHIHAKSGRGREFGLVLWKPLVKPADLRGFGEVRLMPSGHKCHNHDSFNAKAGKVLAVYDLQDQH